MEFCKMWISAIHKGENTAEFNSLLGEEDVGKAIRDLEIKIHKEVEEENKRRWISEGKNLLSDVLRVSATLEDLAFNTLSTVAKYTGMAAGVFFDFNEETEVLEAIATFAYNRKKFIKQAFNIGEGLVGEAAFEKDIIYRTEIPEEYVTIKSGLLGDAKPRSLIVLPLISDKKIQGVVEFASLAERIDEHVFELLKACAFMAAQAVFALKTNKRTALLLEEMQKYTRELMTKQEMLNQHAIAMQQTQAELQKTNQILEAKIREVRNSEFRIQSILENIAEVITIYDKDGLIKYESPSMKNVFGVAENEVKMSGLLYNVGPTGHPLLHEAFRYLLDNPYKQKTVEFKYVRKNGEILWLQTTGRNLLHNEAIQGIVFSTSDITIHKLAEREQQMKSQMQALSENSPDMIVRLSIDGQFYYTNPVFEQFTGYRYKDVMKKYIEQIILDDSLGSFFAQVLYKTAKTPCRYDIETEFKKGDEKRIMHVNIIPETNEEKIVETILIVAHDITEQKKIELEIKEKNKKIQESINYARHIQESILPTSEFLKKFFPESFLLYMPRDLVSGDFPWFFVTDDAIYFAAVDCTGHGVPGAMISFIGHFSLNNIVNSNDKLNAGEILDMLHYQVRKTLRQEAGNSVTRDGMDIALCKFIPRKMELHFAGAHRPLYLLRNNEVLQYEADLKAIGGIPPRKKAEKPFVNHVIPLRPNDRIFVFSDGLPDQEGGPSGLKYSTKRIRDGLLANSHLGMEDLKNFFVDDFTVWKSKMKQIDDVLMLGVEIDGKVSSQYLK
ncbi:MAG: PAS domain S-box protein [Bacteroidales bacterium]